MLLQLLDKNCTTYNSLWDQLRPEVVAVVRLLVAFYSRFVLLVQEFARLHSAPASAAAYYLEMETFSDYRWIRPPPPPVTEQTLRLIFHVKAFFVKGGKPDVFKRTTVGARSQFRL